MPERSGLHFVLLGVPVRVEPWFFMISLFALQTRDLTGALIWASLVFVGVLVHEFGHALAMRSYGFAPSITLHALGGFTAFPLGANPTPKQNTFITLAGPVAGLTLGGVALLADMFLPAPNVYVSIAIEDAKWINIGWSFINLLPILPWDGGLILDSGLQWITRKRRDHIVAVSSMIGGALILAFAIARRQMLLGYFGAMGAWHGYNRWKGASPIRTPIAQRKEASREDEEEAQRNRERAALVSDFIAKGQFDQALELARAHPDLAASAATKLFEARAYAQALELCTAERIRTGDGVFAYNEACCLCRLGRLDDAVTALQKAKTLGYADLRQLQTDEDLEPIRNRPEVQSLLRS